MLTVVPRLSQRTLWLGMILGFLLGPLSCIVLSTTRRIAWRIGAGLGALCMGIILLITSILLFIQPDIHPVLLIYILLAYGILSLVVGGALFLLGHKMHHQIAM